MRIDKYLWAIRVFKTRSLAADACRGARVKIEEQPVKPSRIVKIGDVLVVRKGPVYYSHVVLKMADRRLPAKEVPLYAQDITPAEELEKLQQPIESVVIYRKRGTGRPTKKERRQLDKLRGFNE
ncbi:MAG: RNA-binding S4 domain-containing protein [Bacteroidales bacterium]|nr:RNA-binding S4 domain-containing protein [Bacteroidales bacterium]